MTPYDITCLADPEDWIATLREVFPDYAGEPAECSGHEIRVTFAAPQPKLRPDTPALRVTGDFSSWPMSKYKLIVALAAAGKADAFFALLDAVPRLHRELWCAAQELRTDDPLVVALLPQLPAALGCSAEDVSALLAAAEI